MSESDETDTEPCKTIETKETLKGQLPVIANDYDPALYANGRITSATISLLVNRPCQPEIDYNFLISNKRRFFPVWFSSTLPDGTSKKDIGCRTARQRMRCTASIALLFGEPTADVTWARDGYVR